MRALARVQEQFGVDAIGEDALWEIVAQEEKRIADAAVLAEILLPKLSAVVRAHPAPVISTPTPPQNSPALAPVTPSSPKTEAAPMARNAPLGVADLIQGMLDQDRSDSRPRSASR